MRVAPSLLGFALIASIAVTGCSKREELKVAEFKDKVITVAAYEDAYANVQPQFLPKATGMEGRKEFLNTMLNKEVMAYKADELGYDKDPAVVQGMEGFKRMTLQVGYLKKRVADKVTITDKDLQEHYNNMGVTLSVKQILTDTADQAEECYAALKGGLDFDSACRQYSKSEDGADGGLVVTVAFGALVPDLQTPLFRQPVGGYTEPVLTQHGWVIVKVLKRSDPVQKKPFAEVREDVEVVVRRNKEAMELNKFTEKMRDDYGVAWNYDNMAVVFNAMPPDRSFDDAPRRGDEVYPLLYFDSKDLDKPLVSYQGKTITIKDFSDYYDQASFFTRPRRQFRLGGIRAFLTERIMNEISQDAVAKSNMESDPDVMKVIQAKKEELMINLLYEDMISKQTVVTAQEIQNYYNDNVARFQTPEKRRFGVVLTGDIETAQQASRELKAGKPLRSVVLAYSIDEETRDTMGESPDMARGEQPEIDTAGFSLAKVGDVSEPFQTSRGWMVLKLIGRTDERTFSLEEARPRVEAALREIKNEQRLEELLGKWKEEYNVVIYDDNLEKVQVTERSASEATPTAPRAGARG
jgi:parvulin-like peptidyl-prolyl isomerase